MGRQTDELQKRQTNILIKIQTDTFWASILESLSEVSFEIVATSEAAMAGRADAI